MKKMLLPAAALSVALMSHSALADPLSGAGTMTCTKLASQVAKNPSDTKFAVVEWGLGFLTAMNVLQKPVHDFGNDVEPQLWKAVADYCNANPENVPVFGMIAWWKSLPTK